MLIIKFDENLTKCILKYHAEIRINILFKIIYVV